MGNIELTNMCMIYDARANKVLVQDRQKSWKGFAFPGGHVEKGEGIIDSTIREVKEETGLAVSNLELCGIIHWYNADTGGRYMVFSYRTSTFEGELLEKTEEGRLFWVDPEELETLPLSRGMKERLPMFFDKMYSEGFGHWHEVRGGQLKWQ